MFGESEHEHEMNSWGDRLLVKQQTNKQNAQSLVRATMCGKLRFFFPVLAQQHAIVSLIPHNIHSIMQKTT